MIAKLMALSVRARWAVLFLFLVIAGLGVWQLTKLPIDAVPDITNKQVQINTIDPRLSPGPHRSPSRLWRVKQTAGAGQIADRHQSRFPDS